MDKVIIHDVTTDEVQIVDATIEEQKEIDARRKAAKERIAQEAIETTAKAEAKAALLAKLGITEEEAALLLGGN
jgi:F0F1-type ATP synthase epsilon subunit